MSVLFTNRSSAACTTVSCAAALLLARLLSLVLVAMDAVPVIRRGLGGAFMKSGRTTMLMVAVAPEFKSPRLQLTVLVAAL